ncbi:isocitrate lyase/phosphoenolpyruvate mutase family protein [Actinoplanes siamensis]|uniref:2-methylisocitrate lyase n=1 Tax=Actinoplanes siamensis TaxID=1223317 RepID=A0A919TLF6_9ACTN|nr:isocitrate lyase/phosphoenolpyruvate mutase family protein [Actinoplanes siamensis]GIF06562.1 2-methylisocitrate lyase [Actinoplanes siamensis]
MAASALRALLTSGRVTHVPGVHDPLTAALAVAAGHQAVHLSSAAVSATMLGRSDLDFVHATQIADRAATLAPALRGVPLLADAGTGYDSPPDAVWTGLAYARAGVSGLVLGDRSPDHPAVLRIRALADQVPELAVVAKIEVYAVSGLAGTIERCAAYAEAGADAVFLPTAGRPWSADDGVPGIEELAAVGRALPGVPLVVERSEAAGHRTTWTDAELAAAGVRLVLHPVAALLAAMRAASLTYRALAETGTADRVDRLPWAAFTTLADPAEAHGPDAAHVPEGLQT